MIEFLICVFVFQEMNLTKVSGYHILLYSIDILFCSIVAFTYLENWNKGRGAFILRQLVKQFTLDIVVFDPYNLFVSQKCSFDEGEYKGNTIVCSTPFDPNFFLKIYRLIILDITTHLIIINIIIEYVY